MPLLKPRYPKLQNIPAAKGIVGAWPFSEGAGKIVRDRSGSRADGTLTNGPTWVAGPRGNCLNFVAASNQGVSVASGVAKMYTSANLKTTGVSYVAWVKDSNLDANDNSQHSIMGGNAGNGDYTAGGIHLYDKPTFNLVALTVFDGSYETAFNASDIGIATGIWYFVVGVIDSPNSILRVYVNGNQVATQAFTPANCTYEPTTFEIGMFNGGYGFHGLIDGACLYTRAISAAEVKNLYVDAFRIYRQPGRSYYFGTAAAPGGTSKYLVKPSFVLPGGLIVPVGAAAHSLLALQRNASMTRRRALSFFGWNRGGE
jgi:hypothetical protein